MLNNIVLPLYAVVSRLQEFHLKKHICNYFLRCSGSFSEVIPSEKQQIFKRNCYYFFRDYVTYGNSCHKD